MSSTLIADVNDQVKNYWSDLFMDELKESSLLPSLVSKQYSGEIKKGGDKVRISQINRPTAQNKQVGAGHETFSSEKLSTQYVDLTADRVISASFEFDDLVEIQSQIGDQNSKIRQALKESVDIALNDYLYSLVAPSASAPDHITTGVTDFNAAALGNERVKAAKAQWMKEAGWWGLLSPAYYQDILNTTAMVSKDYGADESPVIGGQIANKRFGFNLLEDNSAGLETIHASDAGLFFHPDFMHLALPKDVEFKISDLHSNHQFAYVISVRMICGAVLGNDGAVKHTTVIGS